MKSRRFIQCDVFSPTPVRGNALAVVVDGEGLSEDEMQRFAAWTNLAETTFISPPQDAAADYKLRIYSLAREMLFAGHPTLGSCASWLHSGGVPREAGIVRQQCEVGIVEIDISDDKILAFTAPPTSIRPMQSENFEAIVETLQIPPDQILNSAEFDNGPVWQFFELNSAESVLALDSTRIRWPEFRAVGFLGAYPPGSECDYEVRMLAPSSGMSEDPITGSLNSAIAHWLQAEDRLSDSLTIAQGTSIGRHGRVSIQPVAGSNDVKIGGQVHILIEGTIKL